ncbi:MAG: hypothetical protein HY606_00240 [Planctomycetes bacterium]|nr:hypothetical protein [Planctomycetota bacterium]
MKISVLALNVLFITTIYHSDRCFGQDEKEGSKSELFSNDQQKRIVLVELFTTQG